MPARYLPAWFHGRRRELSAGSGSEGSPRVVSNGYTMPSTVLPCLMHLRFLPALLTDAQDFRADDARADGEAG